MSEIEGRIPTCLARHESPVSVSMSFVRLIFGRRLASGEEPSQRIGPIAGVATLGLDALASAAYGPEAALTVLRSAGPAAATIILPLSLTIIAVLLTVYVSYLQTIDAYPSGGGSYTVARENLGPLAGVVAASALGFDYALNVAVAISAGVGALVSAVPTLHGHELAFCLGILAGLALVNLRGLRETGVLLSFPTHAFVGCMLIALGAGSLRAFADRGPPVAPFVHLDPKGIGLWLVLRAFASGCTALTGVEAVSNGVPAFREPTQANAKRTLTLIIGTLAFFLLGMAILSAAFGITATEPGKPGYRSILSQIIEIGLGRGGFYYLAMASTMAVLCLSANTSFAGFPRLCRLLANDRYAPSGFRHRGRRLAFTTGIVALALFAFVLLVGFGGITDRLIPLFAVGAFLAFTMSQVGMVGHWWRRRGEPRAMVRLIINGLGACATGGTLIVIVVSKFVEGAWLAVIAIPAAVMGLCRLHGYYRRLDTALENAAPLTGAQRKTPVVLVPLRHWDRIARKALLLGMTVGSPVHALQVLDEDSREYDLTSRWNALVGEQGPDRPKLTVLYSPYRRMQVAIVEFANRLAAVDRERYLAVVVPELVERRWYHAILHAHRATLLSALLLLRGGPNIIVVRAPWYFDSTLRRTDHE